MGNSNREIRSSRLLDAPRELVWKAFTDPEHIKQWWGPNGFTNTIHKMDVRRGGEWNFIMHGPDGTNYRNEIHYVEVTAPERLVLSHGPTPRFQMTIELFDRGSKTEVHWCNLFETEEDYKRAVEVFHAIEGQKQTIDRLESYLSSNFQPH